MMTRRLIATAALPFALQRIGKGSGKDWPPGTVSCFRTGADALGIGQITGGRVQPHRLRTHGRTGNIKDTKQTHA